MGNDLHAIVQAAVVFDINTIITAVADFKDTVCIVIIPPADVNFQLNTKETRAIAIENRLRLVAVFMNDVGFLAVAFGAVEAAVVFISIIIVDNAAAMLAVNVVISEAAFAKAMVFVRICVIII